MSDIIKRAEEIIEKSEQFKDAHRTVPMTWEELEVIKTALGIRKYKVEEQERHEGDIMMGIKAPETKQEALQKFYDNTCFTLTFNRLWKPKYKFRLNRIEKDAIICQKEMENL